ncbi:hypothetical protein BU23DRAFT_94026 [Bimuria novae-zelandiae CBS 107.79]|uniref:3-carboxymuconate cyclase n=1 Tax=Bimuria novae-zelandiae CBS 107.79 TaxID=1447943 RepID=A0A6A5VCC0_9PLEO|nr:hypothetical protein BU23DRAFT_94026 [Bimuria novae-zelandiae CBS 107.79]
MIAFSTKITALIAVFASFGESAPHHGPKGSGWNRRPTVGKAVYFITNEAENAVVALPIGRDGKLSAGTSTKTGGSGGIQISAMTGQPALSDALVSQSSLTVVGNYIFAVNAGSNTVTMLAISHEDPTCLTVVGKPVPVPGEFPTTVAASAKNKLVCVGITGAVAGISCASFSGHGIGKMDEIRPIDLGQSTPPVGPPNTVSQTFFSLDETRLYTTVKGDPMKNKTGFLSAYEVEHKRRQPSTLGTQDVRSSPNGTMVLFGADPIPGPKSTIFAADASFGAAILSVDKDGKATTAHMQTLRGQRATCWTTISHATKSAFVTDAAVNRIVEMSITDARPIKSLNLTGNGNAGLIDLKSAGNFLYALSPGNGTIEAQITVVDVSGGQGSLKEAQIFGLAGFARNASQGMAVLT